MAMPWSTFDRADHEKTPDAGSSFSDPTNGRKRKRPLPSPPTSASPDEAYSNTLLEHYITHQPQAPCHTAPGAPPRRSTRRSVPSAEIDNIHLLRAADTGRKQERGRKRRKIGAAGISESSAVDAPVDGLSNPRQHSPPQEESNHHCDPVAVWARTQQWPSTWATMSQERGISPPKRSRTPSYTQSMKDGSVPRAYSPAFEQTIAEHGLHMGELQGRRLVSEAGKRLRDRLLCGRHDIPAHTSYPLAEFLTMWDQLRGRNEMKIFRDLTSLLVPSPELLLMAGHDELAHVREELSVEWTRSKTMGGPQPKPDCAVGLAATAFTAEEVAKLKNHTSFERPTLFTDQLYFPFVLCEVKCGNEALDRADRQNMHSASIAADAVVQLYRAGGEEAAAELNGEVLVLSISHNHDTVKCYGHFGIVQNSSWTFHRYHMTTFTLGLEDDSWKPPHDYVREIYRIFHPHHLERIRTALGRMADPRLVSSFGVDESDSQGGDPTPSSQDDSTFKVPLAPASKRQKGEMALLREQIAKQEQQYKEQMAKQEQQYKEQMAKQEQQMAKQEQQYKEQMAKQEQQFKEQGDLLKQLLARKS